jgi:hypothetical protein
MDFFELIQTVLLFFKKFTIKITKHWSVYAILLFVIVDDASRHLPLHAVSTAKENMSLGT